MARVNRWHRNNRPPNVRETQDRLGDYLVALYFDFIVAHSDCKRGLNIRVDLKAYEVEQRQLVKLAATGNVVSILLRFGRMLESYLEVLQIPKSPEVQQWRSQMEKERQERVELFQRLLVDEQSLVLEMGDECQQVEILTLLKRDLERYQDILTPGEMDVMSDVYDRVVAHSGIVMGSTPSWFLSSIELPTSDAGCFLNDVRVSKSYTTLDNHVNWEHQEAACLRQAATWTDLNHPHVAKLLAGSHVGKKPFLVHEPAEPMIKNRESAISWKPILGWALGLQYLHERELGYKSFANEKLLVRHTATSSGVLSGLGLVPVQRQLKAPLDRGYSNMLDLTVLKAPSPSADGMSVKQERWTVPDDVREFGIAIYNTRKWAKLYGTEAVDKLPRERPDFLTEREWDLIQKMCVRAPQQRVNMWYVVHQLQSFVAMELSSRGGSIPVDLSVSFGPADDSYDDEHPVIPETIDDFIVPKMHAKIVDAMPRLEQLLNDMPETSEMLEHVLKRLQDVRDQLQAPAGINDVNAVKQGFVDLLNQFYLLLERHHEEKKLPSGSVIANFCGARAAAQNISSFHHEIDRLLTLAGIRDTSSAAVDLPTPLSLSSSRGNSSGSIFDTVDVHDWKLTWNKMRRQQLRNFQDCLTDTSGLKSLLNDPRARDEAQMLLQFEADKRRGSYPDSVLEAIRKALRALEDLDDGEPAESVPSWFIPPYEIQRGERIAGGGFADVFYGKWFDTDVVIKILKPQSASVSAPPRNSNANKPQARTTSPPVTNSKPKEEEDPVVVFRREADHWFMLSHQNVVHLYGACHVGRPFFVCEIAKKKLLTEHLESLASQTVNSSSEQKRNSTDIKRSLYLAGLGLKYLHERDIIHSDLKANNLMVGTDEKNIKLGDFGLSVTKRPGVDQKTYVAPGAFRWKAPEVLLGKVPSEESDIFGFGMCILELLSGAFPWGNQLPETAVKFHVTKRKKLPNRPRGVTDFQWSLIQRMCCYEPSERISLVAAVDMLNSFRYEEPRMGSSQ